MENTEDRVAMNKRNVKPRNLSHIHITKDSDRDMLPFSSKNINWGEYAREIAKVRVVPSYELGSSGDYESTFNKKYYFAGRESEFYEEDEDITYVMNNFGHRSDDFKKEHDGKHLLFAGCSETFGFGSNIEHNWSKLVYNKISEEEKVSGFYRLSFPGGSWQIILNNVVGYIEKFGAPDSLYILMPNLERHATFNPNGCYYEDKSYPDTVMILTQPELKERDWSWFNNNPILTEEQFFSNLANFGFAMRMFELLCRDLKIDLKWSCWSHYSDEFIQTIPHLNKYISMFDLDALEYARQNPNPHFNSNRSDHVNLYVQEHWANTFMGYSHDSSNLSTEEIEFLKKDLGGKGDYIY